MNTDISLEDQLSILKTENKKLIRTNIFLSIISVLTAITLIGDHWSEYSDK